MLQCFTFIPFIDQEWLRRFLLIHDFFRSRKDKKTFCNNNKRQQVTAAGAFNEVSVQSTTKCQPAAITKRNAKLLFSMYRYMECLVAQLEIQTLKQEDRIVSMPYTSGRHIELSITLDKNPEGSGYVST